MGREEERRERAGKEEEKEWKGEEIARLNFFPPAPNMLRASHGDKAS